MRYKSKIIFIHWISPKLYLLSTPSHYAPIAHNFINKENGSLRSRTQNPTQSRIKETFRITKGDLKMLKITNLENGQKAPEETSARR